MGWLAVVAFRVPLLASFPEGEMKVKRILCTGSREWTSYTIIREALHKAAEGLHPQEVIVVHGAAPGADRDVDLAARRLGFRIERHPAIWRHPDGSRNNRGGIERNERMVALGADECLAFFQGESRGTTHCSTLAAKAGIPVTSYTNSSEPGR